MDVGRDKKVEVEKKKGCPLILLQIFLWPALTKIDDFY